MARGTRKGCAGFRPNTAFGQELLIAQTGYMQGGAGIGMWLLRLDAAEQNRQTFVKFPDSPW